MTFKLYDDPTAGGLLWSESQSVSVDSAGIFSAVLGDFMPIAVSFSGPVWLEVEVEGEILLPRRELVSVPYSFYTREAEHAGKADSADWAAAASNALNADMLNSLQANAFSDTAHHHDERYYPRDSLSASGTINDAANPVDWTRLKNVPAGFADGADDGGGGVGDGHSLDASDGDPVDALYVDAEGDVGIGTGAPAARLDVAGTVRMEGFSLPSGADSGLVLTSDAEGLGTWQASPVYADTSHSHDDAYYTETELNTSDGDGPNAGSNRVSWDNLTDVPPGFADGSDDEGGGVGDGHSLDASDGDPGDALYVDDQGEVGIGTTAPEGPLHVFRDWDSPVEVVIENPNTGANSAERLSFGDEDGKLAGISMFDKASSLYASQMIIYNDRPDGAIGLWAEGLPIMTLKDGRVGVGEVDPMHTLDVNGTLGMTGFRMSGGVDGYVLTSNAGGYGTWQPAAVGDGHSLDAADGAPVDALYVSNSGSVGIGTTTPNKLLHLDGQNSEEAFIRFTHDGVGSTSNDGLKVGIGLDGDALIWNREAGDISFGTNSTQRMRITAQGDVGIGTLTPFQRLQVSDDPHAWVMVEATGTDGIAGLGLSNDVESWEIDVRGDMDDALVIRDNSPGNNRMVFQQSGDIGFGIDLPQKPIHIHRSGFGDNCHLLITNAESGWSESDGLLMGVGWSGSARLLNQESAPLHLGTDGHTMMTFAPDGNIGIGISEPQTRLHLHTASQSNAINMQFTVPTSGTDETDGLNIGIGSDRVANLWNYENTAMRFATNGSERMRITADGKVGIGEQTPELRLELSGGQRILGPEAWPSAGEGMELVYNDGIDRGFIQVYDRDGSAWGELSLGASMVGVGVVDPSEKLDITGNDPFIALNTTNNKTGLKIQKNGTTEWEMAWNEGSGYLYFYNAGTRMVIEDATGDVGIGTGSPGYRLDVAGTCHASSFPTSSDSRFKENVEQLSGVLDKLDRLRGVKFDWNSRYESLGRSTGHREIGVIAQEIEEEFPELVTTWGDDDYRAVDYGRMAGVFIEAIKELRAENQALRDRIEALEKSSD
jgi:hypothetical protein